MTEQQPYRVIQNFGTFELREYPEYLLAQVQVRGDFITSGNKAFNPLLRYITGNNTNRSQMAMTAPVLQTSIEPDHHLVSFVLPVGVKSGAAPTPIDGNVHVVEVPRHLAVAHRFGGLWNYDRFLNEAQKLEDAVQAAINSKQLAGELVGEPYFARYNGPFTPWFLRRNEAVIAFTQNQ